MKPHPILRDIGTLLKYWSFCLLAPVAIAAIYGEIKLLREFVFAFFLVFVLGMALSSIFSCKETATRLNEGLVIVALFWLVMTFIGSLFFYRNLDITFLDAFFESMSSWTTTGLTVLNPETLPKTLVFWRSFGQWIGGLGIVVLALGGLFKTSSSLYVVEGRSERIRPNLLHSINAMWWLYGLYTLLGIIFLTIFGMHWFDAINHAMTALSTGGMSTKAASIAAFNSLNIEIVLIVLMIIGNISFFTHYHLIAGETKRFLKNIQNQALFIMIIIATLLIASTYSFRSTIFHVISAISTGYQIESLVNWSGFTKAILIILMIIGGTLGSTAGGLKLNRVIVLFKSLFLQIMKFMSPKKVFSRKIGNVIYEDKDVKAVFNYIAVYLLILLVSAVVFMFIGHSPIDSLFQVASAQGNIGLSVISNFTVLEKTILMFNMWIGRLEIWSVLILIIYLVKRRF
jgi:trk system potassium uptake protein